MHSHGTCATDALEKGLPAIFGVPGGKRLAAARIARMLPPHAIYVEPFAGSAAVFFAKNPAPLEVLSDLRDGLIDTFRFFRDTTDFSRFKQLKWTPGRRRYEFLLRWQPKTLIGKAYKFIWIARASLLNSPGEGYSPRLARDMRPPLESRYQKWHDRLQNTILLKWDAFKVIPKFDSPYTAYYLDPPYPSGRDPDLYGPWEFAPSDLGRLIEMLTHLRGKFLLSLNRASVPERLPKKFYVRKLPILYPPLPPFDPQAGSHRPKRLVHEVIISNFETP